MNCQNCHELIEPGAAFCGNCGYPVQATSPAPNTSAIEQVWHRQQPGSAPLLALTTNGGPPATTVPAYALASASQHAGETSAIVAVICGIIGIAGAGFLIPIIGLVFGIAGLCMGTVSRRKARRRLALIGLIIATLAIVAALAGLVWNLEHNKSSTAQTGQSDGTSRVLSQLKTPCYSFNLIDTYNVSNSSGSCNTTAFNGQSFTTSTDIYKIVATNTGSTTPGSFTQVAKQAIDSDIQNNLPGFTVTSQGASSFAGSLAYTAYALNKNQDTAVVETGVFHTTASGDNAFVILHGVNGSSTSLQSLEAEWRWQ